MSSNAELIGVIETMKNVCLGMATGGEFSYEKYEAERQKIMSYPELKSLIPDWVVKSRYGQQYWEFISKKFATYSKRSIFLRSQFDEMTDAIKMGSARPVSETIERSISSIDNSYIGEQWRKVIGRSQSDPEGAITASKTLLESVMKYILDKELVDYTKNDDFVVLYKLIKKNLNLDPKNHNIETFKQILTGVTSVVQGFGSLRNDYGDAHGKGSNSYIPEQRHAELVINLAGSLSSFLIDTYNARIKI
jgi:hypothetical protein